ncbi:alcohol dehydrogenase catalytic domain-containing protein [Salinimonas marina]|uniref:Alcohol dehydrogenase catalytic domain-containing protein n=1 Tax=Salinimonas marina TaxID=2785918 RepID=A0A7S9DX44_9ALTE|nr:alcohol dehydrogenase catalytic domain-containing protein [Salinimonas marina]QPG05513.1 alcohol dehydrogenase catalytic domain-containing protein [Salinimonas marina]
MTEKVSRVWQFHQADSPLTLTVRDLPDLCEDELLIENYASGINPVDWKFIESNPLNWPAGHTPGVDGAGEVVACGSKVPSRWLGQKVAYHGSLQAQGSFAGHTVVKANRVMRLPAGMSFEQAAALPCPLLTAWQAVSKIPYAADQKVVVAGLGAVNKLTVQLLQQAGFEVDAVSASLSKQEAMELGIDNLWRGIPEVPQGYYAIVDAVNAEHAANLVPKLTANGHVVCIQGRIEQPVDAAFTRTISYHEVALGALHRYGDQQAWTMLMREGEALLAQVAGGQLQAEPAKVFQFEKLNDALTHSRQIHHKTLLGKAC